LNVSSIRCHSSPSLPLLRTVQGSARSANIALSSIMSKPENNLRAGYYARKQIYCKDWLISWSHRCRYEVGLKLTRQLSARRILDYGCGDGSFLAMLAADSTGPTNAVGAEKYMKVVEDCNERLGRAGLRFLLSDELNAPEHVDAYDLIICMEVLEHVPN